MSIKSTIWSSECEDIKERRKEAIYIQSTPAGFHGKERWFSIETQISEQLELPESKMREMLKALSAELDGPKG